MMTGPELIVYVMFLNFFLLTLILYLKIDWHDWGMMGIMLSSAGITVVTMMILLIYWNVTGLQNEMRVIWRVLGLVGSLLAVCGYTAGLFRDPPPAEQVARRIGLGIIGAVVLVIVVRVYLGGIG